MEIYKRKLDNQGWVSEDILLKTDIWGLLNTEKEMNITGMDRTARYFRVKREGGEELPIPKDSDFKIGAQKKEANKQKQLYKQFRCIIDELLSTEVMFPSNFKNFEPLEFS